MPTAPTYRYQPGDRPLDGFTVRAPAGRGGFGEVYFAESDAGREVALKALFVHQGYDEIELRGIRHCMNLKSPHLVSIFDVKTGDDGTPFVIMEYVAGPSLRDLLNDSPQGMGTDKAAFFLREVAKGLSHLHGYGVVHRDLKPANIFYEDGYVKIGDYGLSKLMSADAAASQTVTVGSVHYMAPEIGAGKYDKSIDLYALGCLLYEMLTGRVPYAGTSPTEVLMKHLQSEPQLDDVPDPFARVIKKALQKDPTDRYATAAEMVEDLFGTEHVRNSVSQLNAAELSTYAARAGRKVADIPREPETTPPPPSRTPPRPASHTPDPMRASQISPTVFARWMAVVVSTAILAIVASAPMMLSDRNADEAFPATAVWLLLSGLLGAAIFSRLGDEPRGKVLRNILGLAAIPLFTAAMALITEANGVANWIVVGHVMVSLATTVILILVPWSKHLSADRAISLSPRLGLTHGAIAAAGFVVFNSAIAVAGLVVLNSAFVSPAFALPLIITLGAQLLNPVRPRIAASSPAPESAAPRLGPLTHQAPTAAPPASIQPTPAVEPARDHRPSRHSRLAALLLCAASLITPFAGLHRFYTGRWLTGILWLCTWGLLGIGQLVDGILITVGAFTDARGQRVTRWDLAPAADRPPSSSRHTWTPTLDGRPSTLAIGLHLAGIALLLLGVAFMLPLWFSLPELVDTLPVFAELRDGIGQDLGYDAWPELIERLLFALALTTLIAGTLLTAFARRGAIVHLLRALAGGTLLSFFALFVATGRVIYVSSVERALQRLSPADPYSPLANIHAFLDAAMRPALVIALFWLAVVAALFAIPARRHPAEVNPAENRPPITGNQP